MEEKILPLRNKLNRLHLSGFEQIEIGDMLYYPLAHQLAAECSGKTRLSAMLKAYLKILIFAVTSQYCAEKNGNEDTMLLFSTAYGNRKDLFGNFKEVAALVKNKAVVYPGQNKKVSLRGLRAVGMIRRWNKELRTEIRSSVLRAYVLCDLFQVYKECQEIETLVDLGRIKRLITFCDVHPTESCFTQLLNQRGKCTVTLQHGVYSSVANGWVFQGSKSRYLFAYGQFTKDESERVPGYHGEIVSVGSMSFIGKPVPEKPESYRSDVLGLILDGEDGAGLHDLNVRFIQFSQRFCKARNKKLLIKFHPASNIDDYVDVIDRSVVDHYYGRDLLLSEFMKKIDAALVRNSTCAIETLHYWIPTFIYHEDNQPFDVYKSVALCKFSDDTELERILDSLNDMETGNRIAALREYFCIDGDSEEHFLKALKRIGAAVRE